MSSPGRYQSQMLNFLSQQRLRLKDRYERSVRTIKLLTEWGLQIGLYPIYVLFQSVRLTARQLGQRIQQSRLRLQAASQSIQSLVYFNQSPASAPLVPPTSDRPIWQTMQTVQTFALPLSTQAASMGLVSDQSTNSPQIQGIATLLVNRQLVLVTDDNQILDCLTSQQRDRLTQEIAREVAGFYRNRKLTQATHATLSQTSSVQLLPPPTGRKNQLWPVQVFYRVMGWMQTSQVAIAINLFQEERLSAQSELPDHAPSYALAPSPTQQEEYVLWSRGRSHPSRKSRIEQQHAGEGQWFDPDLHQLDYAAQRFTASPESIPIDTPPSSSDEISAAAMQPYPQTGRLQRRANQPDSLTQTDVKQTDINESHALVIERKPTLENISNSHLPSSDSEAATPWVETKASLVGYVKHPLEQVLEWLDQGMLWLEEAIARAWTWLKRNI
jgi:hypothetical protein